MRRALQLVLLLVVALLCAGCPSGQLITETPTVAGADDQQATCKIAKDPLNPLVVEWPGTAKIDLESTSKRGVVVVSYAGCTLKILSACGAPGAYDYQPTTPARDKLQMSNQNELYARLPLGAASLKGELSSGTSLELDYIAVGQKVVAKPPASLAGECAGATHYVRTITVGAFSLDAHAKGKLGGSVEVGNAGGGIGREENARKLRSQGNVTACAADATSPECGAILQLGLAPLAVANSGAVTSAGFGEGVGPLGVVPTVSTMTDLTSGGVGSLKDVDLTYLDMVQTAKRADKDASMNAEAKAQAWSFLAEYGGANPLRETATQRRDEWRVVAEAETRRKANLEKLRTQYEADKSKLDKLTSLDDDVVPKAQKVSYRKEFEQVYRPFEADLKEIGAIASVAPFEGNSSSNASSSGLPTPPSDSTEGYDDSPFLIGTPLRLEVEGGYGTFLGNQTLSKTLDATGPIIGAQFGLPNLADGFGILVMFRAYVGTGDDVRSGTTVTEEAATALTVGGGIRYGIPLSESFLFEFLVGIAYGTFLDTNVEGFVLDSALGLIFPVDILHFGLRGLFAFHGVTGPEQGTGFGGGGTGVIGLAF